MPAIHYTASEACHRLGVTAQTLYAYVSRGLIRSEPAPDSRTRRYARDDVETLVQRRDLRRRPREVLGASLDWGAPILDSELTAIVDGMFYYRGESALELAHSRRFSEVAHWFWTGTHGTLPDATPSTEESEGDPLDRFQSWLPLAAASERPVTSIELMTTLASWIADRPVRSLDEIPIRLSERWPGASRADRQLLEQTLILCIDHELNISSFTARCVASAGATLPHAVNGALSAFRGRRHGGSSEPVEELFDAVADLRRPGEALRKWKEEHKGVPGFGHRLYPGGDPRAAFILNELERQKKGRKIMESIQRLAAVGEGVTGAPPNLDFALVALRRALRAPRGTAMRIFALGRLAGWIGHAMEQQRAGRLIRPRARYIGPRLAGGGIG